MKQIACALLKYRTETHPNSWRAAFLTDHEGEQNLEMQHRRMSLMCLGKRWNSKPITKINHYQNNPESDTSWMGFIGHFNLRSQNWARVFQGDSGGRLTTGWVELLWTVPSTGGLLLLLLEVTAKAGWWSILNLCQPHQGIWTSESPCIWMITSGQGETRISTTNPKDNGC